MKAWIKRHDDPSKCGVFILYKSGETVILPSDQTLYNVKHIKHSSSFHLSL